MSLACGSLVISGKSSCTRKNTSMGPPLAVVVKAHAHAVPSHAADAELRNGLWMPAGLVANSVMGRAHVEAREGFDLG